MTARPVLALLHRDATASSDKRYARVPVVPARLTVRTLSEPHHPPERRDQLKLRRTRRLSAR